MIYQGNIVYLYYWYKIFFYFSVSLIFLKKAHYYSSTKVFCSINSSLNTHLLNRGSLEHQTDNDRHKSFHLHCCPFISLWYNCDERTQNASVWPMWTEQNIFPRTKGQFWWNQRDCCKYLLKIYFWLLTVDLKLGLLSLFVAQIWTE